MPVDPTRVAFVQRSHRSAEEKDVAVKAAYPSAGEITHETNLSLTSAAALAATYLNAVKDFAQTYKVQIKAALTLDALNGAPPQYTLDAPQYATDGRTFKLVGMDVDDFNMRTDMVIRG